MTNWEWLYELAHEDPHALADNANDQLYTWHYLCDTCRYADGDGAGHFMCLDYAPPEYGGEAFGPIADKLPIPDYKEPHELCLSWKESR